jgi:hypothetical protein
MIRTQVSFDAQIYDEARREAKRLGISFAELCRRAVEKILRREDPGEKPWMRFAGIIDDDAPQASQTVDQVVYGRERP